MKHLKNTILLFFLMTSTVVLSQHNKESLEKIKALKTAFITEQLDLSAADAQKFWPIYNLHFEKLHTLKMGDKVKIMSKLKSAGGIDNLSEVEAKELVNFRMDTEKKIYEQNELMLKDLSTVISQKKIIKLHIAEYEFKKKLIGKLRGKNKDK
jgi:hypothetical protein